MAHSYQVEGFSFFGGQAVLQPSLLLKYLRPLAFGSDTEEPSICTMPTRVHDRAHAGR
jgi:hypothetical protein